jgi:predicted enzyme related to lactoylglutathione lyase
MTKRNIVHIEIPTKDSKASAEFYQKLFGWHIETVEEMNYTMWDPHEGPGGGFSNVDENVKPGDVIIYINCEDIEADLKKAVELGGAIVQEKMEIPETGWFGMFKDPTGNTIALYTSMNPEFNQ